MELLEKTVQKQYKKEKQGKTTCMLFRNWRGVFPTKKVVYFDHKENCSKYPSLRIMNHCKSEIGIMKKKFVDRINSQIRIIAKLKQ